MNVLAILDLQVIKFWSRDSLTYFLKSDLDNFPIESQKFAWWRFKPYQFSLICDSKKWPSTCVDLSSGHFYDLTCLRMQLPAISQWQKYRLPFKRIWPAQILQSYAELGHSLWSWCSFASVTRWKVIRGHTMTSRDKYAFFLYFFARVEIEAWKGTEEFALARCIMWCATRYAWLISWPWT